MHPTRGGRVVLELASEGPDEARFELSLYDPETLWRGQATVVLPGGEVRLEGFTSEPPAWLLAMTRAFLRSEWKARQAAPAPWPRRINRWREERE
jgi:hypothetical protein